MDRLIVRPPDGIIFCLGDISVISEVSQTPMSGLDLSKRLPCGVDEQLRYDITSFLLVRRLHLSIQDENPSLADIITPTKLTSNGTKLDLNNADLLGCTIIQGMLSNMFRVLGNAPIR